MYEYISLKNKDIFNMKYDYIIIGSGSAGSIVAEKLSQNSDPASPEDRDKTSFKLSRSDWGEGHKENVNGK